MDDNADTCELVTFVLNQWGADAKSKISVAEALDVLNNWQPDILVSDISMPGEDEYTLIKKARKLKSKKGTPIPAIALTALARPKDNEKAISAGFQLHLRLTRKD